MISAVYIDSNGGKDFAGSKLIQEARKIVESNFICLMFASSGRHCDWVIQIENVLFTNHWIFLVISQLK